MTQFAHATPEEQIAPTAYHKMRRMPVTEGGVTKPGLYNLAIERGLLTPDSPAPTKDTLIAMLESGISLNPNQIHEAEKQKYVALNQAHREGPKDYVDQDGNPISDPLADNQAKDKLIAELQAKIARMEEPEVADAA
jgi:hypothetical protein